MGRLIRFKLSEIDEWVRQDNEREKTPYPIQRRRSSKSNPVAKFDHAKREIVAAKLCEIPAEAVLSAAESRAV